MLLENAWPSTEGYMLAGCFNMHPSVSSKAAFAIEPAFALHEETTVHLDDASFIPPAPHMQPTENACAYTRVPFLRGSIMGLQRDPEKGGEYENSPHKHYAHREAEPKGKLKEHSPRLCPASTEALCGSGARPNST